MPGTAMKRLIAVSAALAAFATFAGPVYAQRGQDKTPYQIENQQRKEERARIEKQYEAALKKNKTAAETPVTIDPWNNMRGTDDPKAKR